MVIVLGNGPTFSFFPFGALIKYLKPNTV